MNDKRIQELQEKIADLKKRWPAHSVPPMLMQELDEFEEELAEALKQVPPEAGHA
jgi:hypothetical protein